MNFELVNPSDPYTMRAASFEAAVLACLMISPSGMMPPRQLGEAFEEIDAGEMMPFAIGCDLVAWYQERFGRSIADGAAAITADVIEALRSVMIGDATERERMEQVLAAIDDQAVRTAAAEAWHDSKRSSLNDIGARAREIAAKLEARLAAGAATEAAP